MCIAFRAYPFHGFSSERNLSIHKVPLETYMSKVCVYFLTAPPAGFLTQPVTMWNTHTPTVLVVAGIVLSKRAWRGPLGSFSPRARLYGARSDRLCRPVVVAVRRLFCEHRQAPPSQARRAPFHERCH